MSEQQTPPSAAPAAPAASIETPSAASATRDRRQGHIDAALAKARSRTGITPPSEGAPAQPGTPAPAATPPSNAAAAVLGGTPPKAPEGEKPAEDALDANDPRTANAMVKLMELDRIVRGEKETVAQERARLETERAQIAAYAEAAKLKADGKPLAALAALGITYDELTAAVMRGESAPGALTDQTQRLMELEAQLAKLPEEMEAKLKAAQEREIDARVEAYKARVDAGLKHGGDRWGLLTDPVVTEGRPPMELIEQTMAAHHEQTGEVLTWEAAADMLEAQLEVRARTTPPSAKLARILGLHAAPTAPPHQAPPSTGHSPAAPRQSSTLTPALASQAPAGESASPSSRDEYRRRALDVARQRSK